MLMRKICRAPAPNRCQGAAAQDRNGEGHWLPEQQWYPILHLTRLTPSPLSVSNYMYFHPYISPVTLHPSHLIPSPFTTHLLTPHPSLVTLHSKHCIHTHFPSPLTLSPLTPHPHSPTHVRTHLHSDTVRTLRAQLMLNRQ